MAKYEEDLKSYDKVLQINPEGFGMGPIILLEICVVSLVAKWQERREGQEQQH